MQIYRKLQFEEYVTKMNTMIHDSYFVVSVDHQPDFPLIHYCKRPSYCAGYYRLVRSKVTDMRPIDARGKARRLQRISLRRRK